MHAWTVRYAIAPGLACSYVTLDWILGADRPVDNWRRTDTSMSPEEASTIAMAWVCLACWPRVWTGQDMTVAARGRRHVSSWNASVFPSFPALCSLVHVHGRGHRSPGSPLLSILFREGWTLLLQLLLQSLACWDGLVRATNKTLFNCCLLSLSQNEFIQPGFPYYQLTCN